MKISSIVFISVLTVTGVATASIDDDFKSCAATALNDQKMYPKAITVQNDSQNSDVFDHSPSNSQTKYKMAISTKNGKNIGSVTCTFNASGQLKSAQFLAKNNI